jgi:hypothetical protein
VAIVSLGETGQEINASPGNYVTITVVDRAGVGGPASPGHPTTDRRASRRSRRRSLQVGEMHRRARDRSRVEARDQ